MEETSETREAKKRTYENQKENIKKYLKNRYETDKDYKEKINKKRLINNNIKYNTDAEYRAKLLKLQQGRREKMKNEKIEWLIFELETLKKSTNNDIEDFKRLIFLINKIKKARPDFIFS